MGLILNFSLAVAFSFVGSIPPGTINLSMVQLGLQGKIAVCWRFALAAAFVEYPYAWAAVKLESYIISSPVIVQNFQLLTGLVMIVLGALSLHSIRKPTPLTERFGNSGFRRGILLGILNPLAMPFWIGVTAYLHSMQLIDLSSAYHVHSYLAGVFLGALTLLMVLAYTSNYVFSHVNQSNRAKSMPGIILLALGGFALVKYFFEV